MAAVANPNKYHIIAFNANFALSGGVVFARTNNPQVGEDEPEYLYYVVSEFAESNINSRRYPYQGIIEDETYLFTEAGITATGVYTLFCVDGTIESGDEPTGDEPVVPNFREETAFHALNAMIQLTPNPAAYKSSTVKLLTQKAFEFSDEFIKQAKGIREDTGEGDGPSGGGGTTPIGSQSLNGLPAITKVVFCTKYPAVGEQRTVYVKLKKRVEEEEPVQEPVGE
jgi:hypothetical protein